MLSLVAIVVVEFSFVVVTIGIVGTEAEPKRQKQISVVVKDPQCW